MIFVISIFELTKTARSALKVEKQVGSVYLLEIRTDPNPALHSRMNSGQPRGHYLIPDGTFIDKFIHLLIIYYSLAKILLSPS